MCNDGESGREMKHETETGSVFLECLGLELGSENAHQDPIVLHCFAICLPGSCLGDLMRSMRLTMPVQISEITVKDSSVAECCRLGLGCRGVPVWP